MARGRLQKIQKKRPTDMEKLIRTTIDGLDVLSLIRPNASHTVVLLHGFGADMNDLAPLHSYLDSNKKWNWLFPNGPIEVPIGPHMSGHAWFPIRMADIEAAARRGEVVNLSDTLPDGMLAASSRIKSMLASMQLDLSKVVLGGFSQGAMMSCEVALTLGEQVKGMVLLSGTLIHRKVWVEAAPQKKGLPFIQSHGRSDPILGFSYADDLYNVLTAAGLNGEFLPFQGAHEIPLPVINRVSHFLESLLP